MLPYWMWKWRHFYNLPSLVFLSIDSYSENPFTIYINFKILFFINERKFFIVGVLTPKLINNHLSNTLIQFLEYRTSRMWKPFPYWFLIIHPQSQLPPQHRNRCRVHIWVLNLDFGVQISIAMLLWIILVPWFIAGNQDRYPPLLEGLFGKHAKIKVGPLPPKSIPNGLEQVDCNVLYSWAPWRRWDH